ncbi:MAG: beta-aspartyl-peptidase [Bacteroidales bacterium]|nr:beta-aspartyl-peptidase [Bacteroidales bacterium]MCF8336865.1 beta-aspartyl-peptidase [Bacteroidales bacterium]
MILFKSCELYDPEYKGSKDVLVAGGRIIAIENNLSLNADHLLKVVDAKGMKLCPGFIDAHVHIAGAGGEGGPATRTPEMQLSHMINAGVTTVIGCLGTDGMTRSVESVLMKVKSLRAEGVSAWMYTGAYQVPPPTLLGDVGRDITLVEEVIGAGEIALSDHRSSTPTTAELIKLTEHARVGGMLGGKAGIVNIHIGDADDPFRPLHEAVKNSELKYTQFLPTHCTRNKQIFNDALAYGKEGYIDITASAYPYFPDIEVKPSEAMARFIKEGLPLEHITMTSDGLGSLPHFNEKGELEKLEMGYPDSLLKEIKDAVQKEKLPFQQVIKSITSSPADILKLSQKGYIHPGKDADLVLLDENYEINSMMAMGEMMLEDYRNLKKGTYE